MPKVPTPFFYRHPDGVSADEYDLACARQLDEIIIGTGFENVLAIIMVPIGGLATGGFATRFQVLFARIGFHLRRMRLTVLHHSKCTL